MCKRIAGRWLRGNQKISVRTTTMGAPIYIRDGAILPLARLDPADQAFHGGRVDFHVFLSGDGTAALNYR